MTIDIWYPCRSPRGERGLKSYIQDFLLTQDFSSLSSRRAWIEIAGTSIYFGSDKCRSPRGERGLKYQLKLYQKHYLIVALLAESVD